MDDKSSGTFPKKSCRSATQFKCQALWMKTKTSWVQITMTQETLRTWTCRGRNQREKWKDRTSKNTNLWQEWSARANQDLPQETADMLDGKKTRRHWYPQYQQYWLHLKSHHYNYKNRDREIYYHKSNGLNHLRGVSSKNF